MVEYLIRQGADVRSTTSDGDTLLHLSITEYDESRCLKLVKILIGAGCNPTTVNSAGQSALEVAIERGRTSMVEFLLSRNVSFPPNILLFALRRRAPLHMVRFLIRKGVDMYSTTFDWDTLLHLSITEDDKSRRLGLVKIFIDAGCNPTTVDSAHRLILDIAIERGYTSVVEFLLSCRNVPSPSNILLFALLRGAPLHMIDFLICKGADVRSTMSNGDTVLHLAMTESTNQIVWVWLRPSSKLAAILPAAILRKEQHWKSPSSMDTPQWWGFSSRMVSHFLSTACYSPYGNIALSG